MDTIFAVTFTIFQLQLHYRLIYIYIHIYIYIYVSLVNQFAPRSYKFINPFPWLISFFISHYKSFRWGRTTRTIQSLDTFSFLTVFPYLMPRVWGAGRNYQLRLIVATPYDPINIFCDRRTEEIQRNTLSPHSYLSLQTNASVLYHLT